MNFRCLLKELRDMRRRKKITCRKARSSSHIAPETLSLAEAACTSPSSGSTEQSRWADLPLVLLIDIVRSMDTSRTSWPARRDIVACAAVCHSWRYDTKEVVRTLQLCGWFTFPVSLKQKGIRGSPNQPHQSDSLVLKNRTPRWHEQSQCWCLNFQGRVSVASVKNYFQLVTAVGPHHVTPVPEQDQVTLQFGKIAKNIFTMDYCYPLSAFQAKSICLSTFDTKPACE